MPAGHDRPSGHTIGCIAGTRPAVGATDIRDRHNCSARHRLRTAANMRSREVEGSYVRALNGTMDRAVGEGLHAYARWLWALADQEMTRAGPALSPVVS